MAVGERTQLTQGSQGLMIDDTSARALVARFGTPLYVYSAARMRENYKRLHDALQQADSRIRIAYSLKANPNPALVRIFAEAGAQADAASILELEISCDAGMHERIFTGVYAPKEEIERAASLADAISLDDISRLRHVPKDYRGILCFRVNPGSGSGSHPGIVTGGKTKFGIPRDAILPAYQAAKDAGFRRFGLHMMAGSGERQAELFIERVQTVLDIANEIQEGVGVTFELIDAGGGFGIPYHPDDESLNLSAMANGIADLLAVHPAVPEKLLFEPGRYLIGDAGILLTQVTAMKEHPRRYVGVDAGMHTLLRPALYGAHHEIIPVAADTSAELASATVVGPICETTDVLGEDCMLPELSEGDLLAILDTGAYGAVMGSRYGSRHLPKEVLVDGERNNEITIQ